MKDRLVLCLSDGWAVRADELQWMLCRRRRNRGDAISFVATTKAILLRCIREKGAVVDAEGQAALDALPDSFREWKQQGGRPVTASSASGPNTGAHSGPFALAGARVPEIGVATSDTLIWPLRGSLDTRDGEAAR